MPDEVCLIIFKKVKFVDLVNVSATCKRFFMILTSHKEFKQTVTISKRIFNFDDRYAEFLQDKMLDLMKSIQDKFKEEINNEIFSIIYLKIKRISYELTPSQPTQRRCKDIVKKVLILVLKTS